MGAVIDPKDDEGTEPRIDELARELAAEINRGKAAGRTDLRDLAIDVLRTSVDATPVEEDGPGTDGEADQRSTALNPFALGIPLLLVGPFLAFLFPPVGILLVLLGLGTCMVGVLLAIGRSTAARWRHRKDLPGDPAPGGKVAAASPPNAGADRR